MTACFPAVSQNRSDILFLSFFTFACFVSPPPQGRGIKSSNGDGSPREAAIRAELLESSVVSTLNRRSCALQNLVQAVFDPVVCIST